MQCNGTKYFHYTLLLTLEYRKHYASQEYLQQALHFCYRKIQFILDLDCTNHILDHLRTKQLGFFKVNIIYTCLLWKFWHFKEFGRKPPLFTIGYKALRQIIPSDINSFCIRLSHLRITIITDFFMLMFLVLLYLLSLFPSLLSNCTSRPSFWVKGL